MTVHSPRGTTTSRPARVWRRTAVAGPLAALLAVAGCSAPTPTPATPTPTVDLCEQTPDDGPSLQALLDERAGADGVQGGVVVALRRGDEPLRVCVAGSADTTGTPLTADDVFQVGSVTKPFVAVVVMQLVEEGALTLDDDVSDHLPGIAVAEGVTVGQLLDHSSGIPEYVTPSLLLDVLGEPAREWTAQDVVDLVADEDRTFSPGSRQSYSNTNFVLAGLVIEAVTGRTVAEEIAARVTDPLGLTSTAIAPEGPDPVTGFSRVLGDGGSTEDVPYESAVTLAGSAGGLVSTASELITFWEALAAGELVEAGTLASMVEAADGRPADLGLGLAVVGDDVEDGFGHDGAIPGYRAGVLVVPGDGDVVVVLTNDDALEVPTPDEVLATW